MVEVCEGAPVAVSGWVLTDRHDVMPCAASSLHRETMSVSDMIGGTGMITLKTDLMVWHGMAEVREGAPVAVSGWVLADGHDVRPCAASSLLRVTMSVSDMIGGTGTLGMA